MLRTWIRQQVGSNRFQIPRFRPGWTSANNMQMHSCSFLRILVKIHKIPTASRPICNLRGVWLAPFETFLVEHLNPLLKKLPSLVVSTDQLLGELSCDVFRE